jgi:hypothetical protein
MPRVKPCLLCGVGDEPVNMYTVWPPEPESDVEEDDIGDILIYLCRGCWQQTTAPEK